MTVSIATSRGAEHAAILGIGAYRPSRVVGNDPYELRIAGLSTPSMGWKLTTAEVSASDEAAGVTVSFRESPGLLRVTLRSAESREVKWTLTFK